jgi:hypothetical protein
MAGTAQAVPCWCCESGRVATACRLQGRAKETQLPLALLMVRRKASVLLVDPRPHFVEVAAQLRNGLDVQERCVQ